MSFDQVLNFVHSQDAVIIYAILVVSAFVENIFPPYPGDAVTLAGAYIAGEGQIEYIGVLVSVVIGGTSGALFLYYLGKTGGRRFFSSGKGRFLVRGNLVKARKLFSSYGNFLILISRFLAGIRSAIAVTAGLVDYEEKRMVFLTLVSCVLWNGLLLGLMIYSKSNWRMIVDVVKQYNLILIIIGAAGLIIWIIRAIWLKRRNSKSQS
jgi:membrane protein DedA with SNARE-associated domain